MYSILACVNFTSIYMIQRMNAEQTIQIQKDRRKLDMLD